MTFNSDAHWGGSSVCSLEMIKRPLESEELLLTLLCLMLSQRRGRKELPVSFFSYAPPLSFTPLFLLSKLFRSFSYAISRSPTLPFLPYCYLSIHTYHLLSSICFINEGHNTEHSFISARVRGGESREGVRDRGWSKDLRALGINNHISMQP